MYKTVKNVQVKKKRMGYQSNSIIFLTFKSYVTEFQMCKNLKPAVIYLLFLFDFSFQVP